MITKAKLKHIRDLQDKKYRYLHLEFVVEGEKLVEEALGSDFETLEIFANEEWLNDHQNKYNREIVKITNQQLQHVSSFKTPNKVLAIVKIPNTNNIKNGDEGIFLALDNIKDPGNLGTLIRIADWFGVKAILASNGTVDLYNHKTVQASMGSIFRTNIIYGSLSHLLKDLSLPVYGLNLNGENIYNVKIDKSYVLALGSESHGLSEDVEKICNQFLSIPNFSASSKKAESLNAAIAAGIVLSECVRKSR